VEVLRRRFAWLAGAAVVLLTSACRGAGGRAAPLPMPQDFAQWLAIAVFVIGLWWAAMKITRG
jgi:hypothetical protein